MIAAQCLRRRTIAVAGFLVMSPSLLSCPTWAEKREAYTWGKVLTGGGGAIPALVIHPKAKDVIYVGADVGGLDRWDPVHKEWVPTLDFLHRIPDQYHSGVAGIAVDPSDASGNILYVAVGQSDSDLGEVMKSTDRGVTWTRNSKGMFAYCSNCDQGHTQRLAVDPANGEVLYNATRRGLYLSTDAAMTWKKVTNAPVGDGGSSNGGSSRSGISAVLEGGHGSLGDQMVIIDPTSGTTGNPVRSKRVYLSISGFPLYATEDGGSTWSAMPGSPVSVNNAAISSSGVLFCSSDSGVFKYTGGPNGKWTKITPRTGSYAAIAIDPYDQNNLLVVQKGDYQFTLWRSTDGGVTWPYEGVNGKNQLVATSPGWLANGSLVQVPMMAAYTWGVVFDPFRRGVAWLADEKTPWRTNDILAPVVHWESQVRGHEETVNLPAMISPPSGPALLYYGVADFQGFRQTSLQEWPDHIDISAVAGRSSKNLTGADFEEGNPNFAAFVGQEVWAGYGGGGYTTDGGATFHDFPRIPTPPTNHGGRIAVSANSRGLVWAVSAGEYDRSIPYYSKDGGATWHGSVGAPSLNLGQNIFNWNDPLCSDRKNGSKFYIYSDDGSFYRSVDGGATFAEVTTGLPKDSTVHLFANFTTEGELWLSFQNGAGIYHTKDGGSTWSKLRTVQTAYLAGTGKGPHTSTPSLYVMGTVDGNAEEGVFRSDDLGESWTRIDIAHPYPGTNPLYLCGDRRTYGQVFIGSANGIFYGRKGTPPPDAPAGLKAVAGAERVELRWEASDGATRYTIRRCKFGEDEFHAIGETAGLRFTDMAAKNGESYQYAIVAINDTGRSPASTVVQGAAISTPRAVMLSNRILQARF